MSTAYITTALGLLFWFKCYPINACVNVYRATPCKICMGRTSTFCGLVFRFGNTLNFESLLKQLLILWDLVAPYGVVQTWSNLFRWLSARLKGNAMELLQSCTITRRFHVIDYRNQCWAILNESLLPPGYQLVEAVGFSGGLEQQ